MQAYACLIWAAPTASNVSDAIKTNEWARAARLMFVEANNAYPHVLQTVKGQAQAGYVEDAIKSIEGAPPGTRSWLLVLLLREAPALSATTKNQLIQDALASARNRTARSSDYIRSGYLAKVSIYYSVQGREGEAKSIFSEALASANAGLAEEGSGGFRQITEELRSISTHEIKPWMIDAVWANLKVAQRTDDVAFACIDMVVAAGKYRLQTATPFLDCAAASVAKTWSRSRKRRLREALASAQDEIGLTDRELTDSPVDKAIREARAGNPQGAHAIISTLNQNLYVDHKMDGFLRIFDDAIKRRDFVTAKYFAEHPVNQVSYRIINVWQLLAQAQWDAGDRTSAQASYQKSMVALDEMASTMEVYWFDIKSVVELSESLSKHGAKADSRRCAVLAQSLLERISEKRVDDRIRALTAVAELFWRLGVRKTAKELWLSAYSAAHSYDTSRLYGGMEKADLLADVAQSISKSFREGK